MLPDKKYPSIKDILLPGLTIWIAGAMIFWIVEVLTVVIAIPFDYHFKKFVLNGPSPFINAFKLRLITVNIPTGFIVYLLACIVLGVVLSSVAHCLIRVKRDIKVIPLHTSAALGACVLIYAGMWINLKYLPMLFSVKSVIANSLFVAICAMAGFVMYRRFASMPEDRVFPDFLSAFFVLNLFMMGERLILRIFAFRLFSMEGLAATIGHLGLCIGIYFVLNRRTGKKIARRQGIIPPFIPIFISAAMLTVSSAVLLLLSGSGLSASEPASKEKWKPNILFIVMDTARADRLSCYGYGKNTSPYLDKIASEGVIFKNAVSTSSWTLPAHVSMFTGLYPAEHGVGHSTPYLSEKIETITGVLKRDGYRTLGYSNNPWVSHFTGLSRNFDDFQLGGRKHEEIYFYKLARGKLEFKMKDHGAAETTSYVTKWIEKNGKHPFFVFINYMEPHLPYDPPAPFNSMFMPADVAPEEIMKYSPNVLDAKTCMEPKNHGTRERGVIDALYDGEIRYLDGRIWKLYEKLRERNILDKTLIIITSDHGENLGEHGIIGHSYGLFNTLIQVPLIVRFPESFQAGTVVNDRVQTTDVYYTIKDMIGAENNPSSLSLGKSLARRIREKKYEKMMLAECDRPVDHLNWARSEGLGIKHFDKDLWAVISGSYKYIRASDNDEELYDMDDDYGELNNIARDKSEKTSLLSTMLSGVRETAKPVAPGEARKPEIDEETKQKLKSLGYINK